MDRAAQISRRLKLRHLNVLQAVAQWGNMARAAEHLAISQPAVSKSIADLENMLGMRLLDRGPQGVEPTLYGRALLKRSMAIFNDLRTSVNELEFGGSDGGRSADWMHSADDRRARLCHRRSPVAAV
jgi:DNA-binding transcriptional LysR family regulator